MTKFENKHLCDCCNERFVSPNNTHPVIGKNKYFIERICKSCIKYFEEKGEIKELKWGCLSNLINCNQIQSESDCNSQFIIYL